MRYVSVGRRLLATLIDVVIVWLVTLPFAQTQVSTSEGAQFQYSLSGAPFLFATLLWIGYYTVMEGWLGATVGKLVVGIRVVAEDGSKVGFLPAFIRTVSRYVDAFPFFIPYLLGAIMIWASPTRQRLGDRWAHAVVIRVGSDQGAGAMPAGDVSTAPVGTPPPMPPPPSVPATKD
jgi:uncharacterized RDD family membrane protein YckC